MSLEKPDEQVGTAAENDDLLEEDRISEWGGKRNIGLVGDLLGNPIIWAGIVGLALVVLLVALWPKSDDKEMDGKIENLARKIEMLENRIFILESNFENAAIETKELQTPVDAQALQNLETRIGQLELAANQRALKVNNALESMSKKLAGMESNPPEQAKSVSKPEPAPPPPAEKPKPAKTKPPAKKDTVKKDTAKKDTAEYYTVKKGDTLYSIGRKHGVSVDKLMQINKLPKASHIVPGQKLKVTD